MKRMRNLERLSRGISISLPSDEKGLVGRECPIKGCEGYFKIKPGTGLTYKAPCHCPYCGHVADHDQFWTQEQIKYARSVMLREISRALQKDIKGSDADLRRRSRNSFLKLSVEYKGRHHPIHYYREKKLETDVICDECTLYSVVFGAFAFCPDCGTHNSAQILRKNLELAEKELALAETVEDKELSRYLVADALENAVSAFDGFGREVCRVHANLASDPVNAERVSFQNLKSANNRVRQLFGFELANSLNSDEWAFTCKCFQKRHLLAHKMGVVDKKYIDETQDGDAVVGRKIRISADEVRQFTANLMTIGDHFLGEL